MNLRVITSDGYVEKTKVKNISPLGAGFEIETGLGTDDPLGAASRVLRRRARALGEPEEVLGPFLGEDLGIGRDARSVPVTEQALQQSGLLLQIAESLEAIKQNTSGEPTLLKPDEDR